MDRRVPTPLEAAGNARQRRVDPRAAGAAVEEHADFVAARALLGREVDHVAKQTAERRAKDADDPELVGLRFARMAAIIPTRGGLRLLDYRDILKEPFSNLDRVAGPNGESHRHGGGHRAVRRPRG